ncbi:hypothetical protein HMPREF3223_00139 [Cutibacterium avidum]|nr:hypothetical protein HMPREF3223_00139 [Cutibacterium avidum]
MHEVIIPAGRRPSWIWTPWGTPSREKRTSGGAVDGRELRRVLLGVGLLPKPTGAVSLSDYAPTR